MQARYLISAAIVIISLLSGCAGAINPYSSNFTCPKTADGKCVSVSAAYEESINNDKFTPSKKKGENAPSDRVYQEELFKKLSGLLREPATPMVSPAVVMRGLALPYPGTDRELYMYQYVYFIVDDPSFVLGNYLNADLIESESE